MTIQSITCDPPVRRLPVPVERDHHLLETAIQLFQEGDCLAAVHHTLAHLLPGVDVPDLREADLSLAQGSAKVSVRIANDVLHVGVPIARLSSQGNPTAAMRYLLSHMSGSGQLHQPQLHGDEIYFEFRDDLRRMHPIKLLEVVRRTAMEADAVDDWLADQFGAEELGREPMEPIREEDWDRCWNIWSTHWSEMEELVKECQRRRSMFLLNEMTALAAAYAPCVLPMAGVLPARINQAARVFNDSDEEPSKREASLVKLVRDMRKVQPDELRKDLHHAVHAVPIYEDGTPHVLTNLFTEGYLDAIRRARASGHFMDATLALVSSYTYLLARFSWPPSVAEVLLEGLTLSSKQPWRDASANHLVHARTLVKAIGGADDDESEDDDAEDAGQDEEVQS